MIELPIFKCRASASGDIMTNGRKKDEMGATAKTHIQNWVKSQLTGRNKEIESKYLKHGIINEDNGLLRASKYFGCEFTKNTEKLEDEHFTGEYDAKNGDLVIDIKCSWDEFTFPLFDENPPKGYYNQLQVYMALTGLKKASLVFCLENHSEDEIDRLAQRLAWDSGEEEPTMEYWNAAKAKLTHDHLPEWMRIKTFSFDRNEELIQSMRDRVEMARNYINTELLPKLEKLKNK